MKGIIIIDIDILAPNKKKFTNREPFNSIKNSIMNLVRKLTVVMVLLFVTTFFASAQVGSMSGFRVLSTPGVPDADAISINRVSANNAWFGSNFQYNLTGDENAFDDNFIFNANLMYNIRFDSVSWNFPIYGNVALPSNGDGGINQTEIGIYPWKVVSKADANIITVMHGGLSYLMTPEEKATLSPQEFRASFGFEFTLPLKLNESSNRLPMTLSLVPTWTMRNLERDNTFGLDGTFIFPISESLGVIGNLDVPFTKGIGATLTAGVITNGTLSGLTQ